MPALLDVRTLDAEFRGIISEYAPVGATLELVDSVQEWALEHGLPENNAFRQAKAIPGRNQIVMCSTLSEDSARSSSSIFRIGPVAHEALAQDLRKYGKFLLLHEIAHLRGMQDEDSADRWALATLNEILARAGEPRIGE